MGKYSILADLTVVAHLGWILFLMFGVVFGRRCRWVRRVHLAGLGFAVLLTASGRLCPLTHLEVWLRDQDAGRGGYHGSFVGHYAEQLVYLEVPRGLVLAGACLILAASLLAYLRRSNAGRPERRKGR